MAKFGLFLLAVLGLVAFIANLTNVHEIWLLETKGEAIVSRWSHTVLSKHGVDVLSEFARLPDADRATVIHYCKEIFHEKQRLIGTKAILAISKKPGCQGLMNGGWHPNWTLADGLEVLAQQNRS